MSNGFRFGPWSGPRDEEDFRDAVRGISRGLWLLVFLIALGVVLLFVPPVRGAAANPMGLGQPSPTVALARTFVRESGLRAYTRDDPAAIAAVVSFRAEHVHRTSFMESLRLCTRNAYARVDTNRPWIAQLTPDLARPPLWPVHLRWERGGDRHMRRTFDHAENVLLGTVEHGCNATPHSWGSEHDAIGFRRENPTAVELDCGQTCTLERDGSVRLTADGMPRCNHFFGIPRYWRRFGGAQSDGA